MIQFKLVPSLIAAIISFLFAYGIYSIFHEEFWFSSIALLMVNIPFIGLIGTTSMNERFMINSRVLSILFLIIHAIIILLLAVIEPKIPVKIIFPSMILALYLLLYYKILHAKQ